MKLTENFSLHEFECKCGCKMPDEVFNNIKIVASNLQELRNTIDKPIKLTNAYRCPEHNAKVGGVPSSQHIKGLAADIQVKNLKPSDVADVVEHEMVNGRLKHGGVGRYDTFTHVDFRGYNARWDKTTK